MKTQSSRNWRFLFIAVGLCFALFAGCKEEPTPIEPEVPNELPDNVLVVDSTVLELVSSPTELSEGLYRFSLLAESPTVQPGDLIVGDQGSGFLRKVNNTRVEGEEIVYETEQASMEELFESADFSFDILLDGTNKTSGDGYRFDLENYQFFDQNGLSLSADGFIEFDSELHFDFSFEDNELDSLIFQANNTNTAGSLTITAAAAQAVPIIKDTVELLRFQKKFVYWVPVGAIPIPVVVLVETRFDLQYGAEVASSINTSVTGSMDNSFDAELRYENDSWSTEFNNNPNFDFSWEPLNGQVGANINVDLVPYVEVKLYGVAGPYAYVELKEALSGNIASPSLEWDFELAVWGEAGIGAEVDVLGKTLLNYDTEWSTDKLQYRTPFSIEKVSGDNQTARPGESLAEPIKVRVLDEFGDPQVNVPVTFSPAPTSGTVTPNSIFTDEDGLAETLWILGNDGNQELAVSTKKADGTLIQDAPLTFNATLDLNLLQLSILEGNNQHLPNLLEDPVLPIPLKVGVKDLNGNLITNLPVIFTITRGDGTIAMQQEFAVYPDPDGSVSVDWTLGMNFDDPIQKVAVVVKDSTLQHDRSNVVEFSASTNYFAQLVKIGGDHQFISDIQQTTLPQPLSVMVQDYAGNPVENLPVVFKITRGGGTLANTPAQEYIVNSDASGMASSAWTLGADTLQTVEVVVMDPALQQFKSDTLQFRAYTNYHFVDPRDGEVYPLVYLADGNWWFQENARYATPNAISNPSHPVATHKAWGYNYNGTEADMACPPGSHLATKLEWDSLWANYNNVTLYQIQDLMATTGTPSWNGNGCNFIPNNSSGLSILPNANAYDMPSGWVYSTPTHFSFWTGDNTVTNGIPQKKIVLWGEKGGGIWNIFPPYACFPVEMTNNWVPVIPDPSKNIDYTSYMACRCIVDP